MLPLLLLALVQGGPAPLPDYQPQLFEPGLDGGVDRSFSRGELTPDGRLLIAFRKIEDETYPNAFRTALTASVTRAGRLVPTAGGNLEGFYDPVNGGISTTGTNYGDEFAFGRYDNDNALSEWTRIHWGNELIPCTDCVPVSPVQPNDGCDCIVPDGNLLLGPPGNWQLDPDYPVSDSNGSAQITLAMRPMPSAYLQAISAGQLPVQAQPQSPSGPVAANTPRANPYRSNAQGTYALQGNHLTYLIWVVRTHQRGFDGNKVANNSMSGSTYNGALVKPLANVPSDPVFVSQDLRITVELQSDGTLGDIADVDIAPFKPLETPALDGDDLTRGIEPSITEDGKLLLFHGNGATGGFKSGDAVVTYIYNQLPCSPTGWSAPRSIVDDPNSADITPWTQTQFSDRYKLFRDPIRLPASSFAGQYTYPPGSNLTGTYPWVSKDGSFFTAFAVRGTDALDDLNDDTDFSIRIKVGGYACGDLTRGFIKHIDDVGVNPTRLGGTWHWPPYLPSSSPLRNSWTGTTFSTGVKPGLWEPLLAEDPLIPTQEASRRIPVLPMFLPIMDTYGEVRFEEADGDYLLYLACNEAFIQGEDPEPGRGEAFIFDTDATPDSSATERSARCTLNAGAAFPQELYTTIHGGSDPKAGSEELRTAVGGKVWPFLGPLHENLGFKGQAIAMNADGAVTATDIIVPTDLQELTVQMWVKLLENPLPNGSHTLFEYGLDIGSNLPVVELRMDGATRALDLRLLTTAGLNVSPVNATLTQGYDRADPAAGWHHLAFVYDSTADPATATFYLDGVETFAAGLLPGNVSAGVSFPGYCLIGPGRGVSATAVGGDVALLVDEAALSRVARTPDEIRRDAYRNAPVEFGPAPVDIALPVGLDRQDTKWPVGLAYDAETVNLGRTLFNSTELSADSTGPLVSGNTSCSSCHQRPLGFVDGLVTPLGETGPVPGFHTPTVVDMLFGTHKTFSGQAASLEEQILLPLELGPEMGTQDISDVVARLNLAGIDFTAAYGPGAAATEERILESLAMYMRTLNSGGSAFDTTTLTGPARRGQELFFGRARCFGCHRDSNFSDDDFHNIGTLTDSALMHRGRFTRRANEDGALKTPSLRSTMFLGPWFHDAQETDMLEVLRHYNNPFESSPGSIGSIDRDLRPLDLSEPELQDLRAFLTALTGTNLPF